MPLAFQHLGQLKVLRLGHNIELPSDLLVVSRKGTGGSPYSYFNSITVDSIF